MNNSNIIPLYLSAFIAYFIYIHLNTKTTKTSHPILFQSYSSTKNNKKHPSGRFLFHNHLTFQYQINRFLYQLILG